MTSNCGAPFPDAVGGGACARPAGHTHDCLRLTGAAGCAMNGDGPTGVIHVRDMGPVRQLRNDPTPPALYLGRAMPQHPDVRVQRGSAYANKWRIDKNHSRGFVLERYLEWLQNSVQGQRLQDHTMADLRGRVLACWCAPVGTILTAHDPIVCHCQLVACLVDGLDPLERLVG